MERKQATILTLTRENFDALIVQDATPILIDFWAPWCGPCRMMTPVLEQAASLLDGAVRVAKANVDEQPELAEAFQIRGIPAFAVVREKTVVDMFSGFMPAAALVQKVNAGLKTK